jgi:hypothetical protein
VAPAIRCDQADKNYRESYRSMLMKLRDEGQRAEQDIALYRRSGQPVDLFNNYVDLQFLLKNIELFNLSEQYNGDRNHQALATAYNSFVKLTEGWFTGEMREVIRMSAH